MVYVSAGRELTWRLSNSQKEATGRHRSATRTARSTPFATTAFPPRPPHQPRRRRRPRASRATPRRHRPRRAPAGRPAHSAAKRRATARRQAGTNATQRRHATCARRAAINTLWTAGRATSVWRLSAARRRHRRFPTQDVPSGRIRQPRPVSTAARESFRTGLRFSHRRRCAPVPLSPEISANGDLVYTACQDNGVPGFGKTVPLAGQILGLRSSRPPLRHVRRRHRSADVCGQRDGWVACELVPERNQAEPHLALRRVHGAEAECRRWGGVCRLCELTSIRSQRYKSCGPLGW